VEVGLARVNLTPSQYRVLVHLTEGSAQASALADHLTVSRPSVTAVVDGLVARGLVDRRHEELDRRRVRHSITTAGARLLREAESTLNATLSEILRVGSTPAVAEAATRGLAAWEKALGAYRIARRAERLEALQ
jgi:long-chain acyl-CoA synthetase